MSPPFPFMLVIFLIVFGGFFLTTSAKCGSSAWAVCGVGDIFGYPFTDGRDSDCGYPGLTFTCNDDFLSRPVLNISGNIYRILSKDVERQMLRVVGVGVDVEEEECPRPMHNFTLPTTSPFDDPYTKALNYNITYFYNCSSSGFPKDVVQALPCLDTNNTTPTGLRSFAFSDERFAYEGFNRSADERFNWFSRSCQESAVVPAYVVYNSSDLKSSVKLGFSLYWSMPEECKDCENSGGQCWFNHTTAGVHHPACSCSQGDLVDINRVFNKVCPPNKNISHITTTSRNRTRTRTNSKHISIQHTNRTDKHISSNRSHRFIYSIENHTWCVFWNWITGSRCTFYLPTEILLVIWLNSTSLELQNQEFDKYGSILRELRVLTTRLLQVGKQGGTVMVICTRE